MAFYHSIVGMHQMALDWISILHYEDPQVLRHPDDLGEFIDAWLEREGSDAMIVVHVRCGGELRDKHKAVFAMAKCHKLWHKERRCSFDDRYTDLIFHAPDKVYVFLRDASKQGVNHDALFDHRTQGERWRDGLRKMEKCCQVVSVNRLEQAFMEAMSDHLGKATKTRIEVVETEGPAWLQNKPEGVQ